MSEVEKALHAYHEDHGAFPPPYTVDQDGNRLHSWRVLILPFMGEQSLYDEIRLDEPWDSPHNTCLAARMPGVFGCAAADPDRAEGTTDYFMATGPGTVGDGPEGTKMGEITDGAGNTVIVVEAAHRGIGWMEPVDFDVALELDSPAAIAVRPRILGGILGEACVLFADGHVDTISHDTDSAVLKALFTISGGEEVEDFHRR